jgi:hypothetical protein
VLDKVVPAEGQPDNHDWLKATAFENRVPPPNCAWELMEAISKKLKTIFLIIRVGKYILIGYFLKMSGANKQQPLYNLNSVNS